MISLSPGFTVSVDPATRQLVIEGYDYDPSSVEWNPTYRVSARIPLTSVVFTPLNPPKDLPSGSA